MLGVLFVVCVGVGGLAAVGMAGVGMAAVVMAAVGMAVVVGMAAVGMAAMVMASVLDSLELEAVQKVWAETAQLIHHALPIPIRPDAMPWGAAMLAVCEAQMCPVGAKPV